QKDPAPGKPTADATNTAVAQKEGAGSGVRGQDDSQDGGDVLTRGVVHEAFAQPVVFNPVPGPVIVKKPPEPVEELPPDQKPEGDNVAWIPGYWTWDND